MTAHKVRKMPYARLMWLCAWRNLRKCMKDRAELAWRLRHGFRFAPPNEYTWYYNHACDAMYERSMPMPQNLLQRR
jgi:hypothetical protein